MAGWTVPGYTETRVLGSRETGRIVEAVHDASGDRVTITYPDPELWSDQAFRERYRADAELLAGVDQNVLRVRELVEDRAGGVALVSEAVEGAALRRVLATSGPLPPEAALALLRGSLVGLAAAQEVGVVHRDCQPANVLIGTDGVVRLTGFGLAVRTEAMVPAPGTPAYLAPELWEGAKPRPATDIYAVTATFYECLTGRVPYTADSLFELQTMHRAAPIPLADVPAALAPLVAQGLAKAPVERPADAAGFLAELEAVAVVEYGMEWEERGRRKLAALVAALLAAAPEDEEPARAAEPSEAPTYVLPVVAPGDGTSVDASADREGMGRGTKAGIAAAAAVVIGAVVAAVTFAPSKHATAATRPPGEMFSAATGTTSTVDGGAPGIAAGGSPKPGKGSTGSSSSAKGGTSGPTSAISSLSPGTTPVSTVSPIGLPMSSLNSSAPLPSYPSLQPPPSTQPTTPVGSSGGPSTTPSAALTISASATMANTPYNGPCPPTANPPTGTVTFTVNGLPSGGTVLITYQWQVVGGAGTTSSGAAAQGDGTVTAQHNGDTTQQFAVTTDQHSAKGTVQITWTAPGTPGGTVYAGSVDITCTTSGGSSGGPTSTGST